MLSEIHEPEILSNHVANVGKGADLQFYAVPQRNSTSNVLACRRGAGRISTSHQVEIRGMSRLNSVRVQQFSQLSTGGER